MKGSINPTTIHHSTLAAARADTIILAHRGRLAVRSEAEVRTPAGVADLNLLAQLKLAVGDLDRVARCVRLCGYINAVPEYGSLPQMMNGASDLMVLALGEAGRHARTTVGVAQVPLDSSVEVAAIFAIA